MSNQRIIPFYKPYFTGNEIKYIEDAIGRNKISGDGYYTKKINTFIQDNFNTSKALFVTSGTAALDMAAILIDLQPGDEVIMPSYTFVSTANSVVLRGARPVFADICPDTLNIDPIEIEKKISKKTKAIYPVHYAGIGCDMDSINQIAEKYSIKVVEDAAQGVYAKYKGKHLGTFGDIGCFSYHETKNYICGEGGSILINNKEYMERAEIIWEKGTNRSKFIRGEVDKYTWVDIGSSFLGSDILAAFLYAQFEQLQDIKEKREAVFNLYYMGLKDLETDGLLKLPTVPEYCDSNFHMFYILLPNESIRDKIMYKLKENGISSVFHYVPLHSSPMGRNLGYEQYDLPITEEYSSRLLRLPLFNSMADEEVNYVIDTLKKLLIVPFSQIPANA